MGQGGYYPVRGHVIDVYGHEIPDDVVVLTPSAPAILSVVDTTFVHAIGSVGFVSVIASYSDTVGSVSPDTVLVTVTAFGAPNGTIVDTIPFSGPLFGVAVSPSRGFVTSMVQGGPLLAFDLPARGFRAPIVGGAGLGVALDPAGLTAYVAGLGQDTVQVIDAATNAVATYVTDHIVGDPRDVIVSPDGQRVFVAVDYTQIYVVSTATRKVIDSIYVPGLPNHFSFHPTAPLLYASLDNAQVAEINVDSDKVVRLFPTGTDDQGTAIAPDGSELYNVTMNNELFVFDLSSGQQVADVHGLGGYGLAASHDGSRLYVAGNENLKIIDRVNRTLIDSIVIGGYATHVAVSRDDGAVYIGNEGWLYPVRGWLNIIY